MGKKLLLNVDELLVWVNSNGKLLKPINQQRLMFWIQSRRVPTDDKRDGRNFYTVKTAKRIAELVRAHQVLKSSIKWRPNRGTGKKRATQPVLN